MRMNHISYASYHCSVVFSHLNRSRIMGAVTHQKQLRNVGDSHIEQLDGETFRIKAGSMIAVAELLNIKTAEAI